MRNRTTARVSIFLPSPPQTKLSRIREGQVCVKQSPKLFPTVSTAALELDALCTGCPLPWDHTQAMMPSLCVTITFSFLLPKTWRVPALLLQSYNDPGLLGSASFYSSSPHPPPSPCNQCTSLPGKGGLPESPSLPVISTVLVSRLWIGKDADGQV